MKKKTKLNIQGIDVTFTKTKQEDFICITDIAKYKNPDAPADIIKNWLRSKNTIELLGLWERLNNPDFKLVEFDQFKNEAIPQSERLQKFNQIAINQMNILLQQDAPLFLEDKKGGKDE